MISVLGISAPVLGIMVPVLSIGGGDGADGWFWLVITHTIGRRLGLKISQLITTVEATVVPNEPNWILDSDIK